MIELEPSQTTVCSNLSGKDMKKRPNHFHMLMLITHATKDSRSLPGNASAKRQAEEQVLAVARETNVHSTFPSLSFFWGGELIGCGFCGLILCIRAS